VKIHEAHDTVTTFLLLTPLLTWTPFRLIWNATDLLLVYTKATIKEHGRNLICFRNFSKILDELSPSCFILVSTFGL